MITRNVPLEPCPFCKGDAIVEHDPPSISEIDRYKIYMLWRVVCTKCGAKIERLQEYRYDGKAFSSTDANARQIVTEIWNYRGHEEN